MNINRCHLLILEYLGANLHALDEQIISKRILCSKEFSNRDDVKLWKIIGQYFFPLF